MRWLGILALLIGFQRSIFAATMIEIKHPISMVLPFPTGWNGTDIRQGAVVERDGRTFISWPAVQPTKVPFDFAFETEVLYLPRVNTREEALRHFYEYEKFVEDILAKDDIVKAKSFPFGTVLTIDLSAAGWTPGNTYVYVLSKDGTSGAVFLSPTGFLHFDWTQASVNFPRNK